MRKFVTLFIFLLIAIAMVACDAGGDPAEKESETEEDAGADESDSAYEEEALETFEGLLTHFEESGLEIGDVKANDITTAKAVGADSGVALTINGIEAQLYHFEDQESEEYQQAVESNTITIEFDAQKIDLQFHANNGFAALDTDYHVDGDEIVEALDSYEE